MGAWFPPQWLSFRCDTLIDHIQLKQNISPGYQPLGPLALSTPSGLLRELRARRSFILKRSPPRRLCCASNAHGPGTHRPRREAAARPVGWEATRLPPRVLARTTWRLRPLLPPGPPRRLGREEAYWFPARHAASPPTPNARDSGTHRLRRGSPARRWLAAPTRPALGPSGACFVGSRLYQARRRLYQAPSGLRLYQAQPQVNRVRVTHPRAGRRD